MVLLTIGFGTEYGDFSKSLYFVSFLMPVAMATSYFFNYYLVPKYLLTRRNLRFVVYTGYMIIVSVFLEMVVVTVSFIVIANYNIRELDPLMNNIFVLCFAVYMVVLLKAFVLLFIRIRNHEFEVGYLLEQNQALKMDSITVKVDRVNQHILLDDLYFIESMDDYVTLYTKENKLVTRESITALAKRLPVYFIRIHRSYLVNKNYISSFNTTTVTVSDKILPIGRTYKTDALSLLK